MTPVVVGVLAGLGLVTRPVWRVSRGWVTLAHELGHALSAIAVEGRVRRIRIHLDTSGLTEWSGAAVTRRASRGVVAWWGHPAPGVLALGLGVGLVAGQAVVAAQVLAATAAVVALVWVRNLWGVVVSVGLVAAALAAAALGPAAALGLTTGVAVLWSVGGFRAAAGAAGQARRGDGSDAAVLAESLWLPVGFWAASMVVISAVAVAGTAALLYDTARA